MAEQTQQQEPDFWDNAGDLALGLFAQWGQAALTDRYGQQQQARTTEPYREASAPISGPQVGTTAQPAQAGFGGPLAWIAIGIFAFYLVNK